MSTTHCAGDCNQFTIAVQDLGCQFNLCSIHALTRAELIIVNTARSVEAWFTHRCQRARPAVVNKRLLHSREVFFGRRSPKTPLLSSANSSVAYSCRRACSFALCAGLLLSDFRAARENAGTEFFFGESSNGVPFATSWPTPINEGLNELPLVRWKKRA